MTTSQTKLLYLGNAHLAREALTYYDVGSDSYLPWTGTPATARFSLSPSGGAYASAGVYTPSTILAAGPFAMTMSGDVGTWVYVFPVTALANFPAVGTKVYQVVEAGPNNELRVIQAFVVTDPRPPL